MKKLVLLFLSAIVVSCSSDDTASTTPVVCDIPTASVQDVKTDSAFISWNQTEASSATIEYGVAGFALGSGTQVTSSESFQINNLQSDTSYDVYISVSCSNGGESSFAGPFNFMTQACQAITSIGIFNIETTSVVIDLGQGTGDNLFEIEYGISGFSLGSGEIVTNGSGFFQLSGLTPSTNYDLYTRRVCGTEFSEYSSVREFTTESICIAPDSFSGNASPAIGRVNLFWDQGNNSAWRVEYGLSGFQLGTGQEINTSSSNTVIEGLSSGETYEFYVQTNCGSNGFSSFVGPLPLIPN